MSGTFERRLRERLMDRRSEIHLEADALREELSQIDAALTELARFAPEADDDDLRGGEGGQV